MLLILYHDHNTGCSISCENIFKNGKVSCESGCGPSGSMKSKGYFEEAEILSSPQGIFCSLEIVTTQVLDPWIFRGTLVLFSVQALMLNLLSRSL